ncbi:MAG: hypothetical protein RL662_623 [Bacteroidota bacterium]|jgi:hypothetical protein
MKKISIPKLPIETNDIEEIDRVLATLPAHNIDEVNWADQYPSKPNVSFRIAHNSTHILLQYQVHENELLALVDEDNGKVWTDSCVEFFVTFNNTHYYNIEASCIGKTLMGHRLIGDKASHASAPILKSIARLSSLGTNTIAKQAGNFSWTLTLVIPCSAYWGDKISKLDGVTARANFYKCGDNLTTPHFVSWNSIETPKPSFHQPAFFGEIEFE